MLWHPSGSDRLFDVTDIRKDIVTVYEYDETKMFVDSARFYWEHGNEAMSGKYYQKAIQLEPRNAALRYHYSLELAHEDIEKAMSQLDTVVEIDTTFLAAYCNRGLYKYKLGRAADAIWEYDEGLKIRPGHPIILLNKALALESLGDKEGACRCLNAALNDQVSDYEGIKEQIDRTKDDMDCN